MLLSNKGTLNTQPTSGSCNFDLVIASTLHSRLRGLLSSRVCAQGEVLVLVPCNSIHTFGMREPIDVAFIDAQGLVLSFHRCLPPARMLKDKRALLVLERRFFPGEPWLTAGQKLMLAFAQSV